MIVFLTHVYVSAITQVDLKCSSNGMTITMPLKQIAGVKATEVTLNDPNCTANHNNTHFSFHTDLDSCGTFKMV